MSVADYAIGVLHQYEIRTDQDSEQKIEEIVMPCTGRAVIAHGRDFEIREYPIPEPEPNTILLRQELAGICGTDLHNWQNGFKTEILLGHENVGIVEAIGDNVETDYVGNPIKEGDRLIFAPGTDYGGYGFQWNPDETPHFRGGFADYMYLTYPNTCYMKTTATPEVAVLTEPFTVGVHAVMRGDIKLGDTIVVQGSGAIGLVTVACAKLSGAGKIINVGGPAGRLELAKKLGADVTIDIEKITTVEERTEYVKAETPRKEGADAVFECAGFLPATPEGLGYTRRNGTFVEVGHFVDMGSIDFNINQLLMRKNLRVEAIWGSRYEHFVRGLPLLEKSELPFADMVSHQLPLSKVEDGFKALDGGYRLDGETAIKIVVRAEK